jgi:hypothetical protein
MDNPTIDNVNKKLATEAFINNHKSNSKDFSRNRVLNFTTVFMLILKKSIKSLQLILNELFIHGSIASIVTSSAYTQARKKFRHTAFIELNDDTVRIFYEGKSEKRWNGFRCIAGDASIIILPKGEEIQAEFGCVKIKNQTIESQYSAAMFLCFYDVLNNIAIKSELTTYPNYECAVAKRMLDESIKEDDLLIFDRCYASYEFLATLTTNAKNYLIRCSKTSFSIARLLSAKKKLASKIVTISAPNKQKNYLIEKGLPLKIQVRFVSVLLSTGEMEILATSLMDDTLSCNDFKQLYHLRWEIEGYFNLLKGRLNLENFTGKTIESIKQDFWSTIFISNIESVITKGIEDEINKNPEKNRLPKKINHAVTFNAIKNMAFDVFLNVKKTPDSIEKMRLLFRTGSIVQRKDRGSPQRKQMKAFVGYNHLKRARKYVF